MKLEAKQLAVEFGDGPTRALRNVTLTLEPGTHVLLTGASLSGKTTLLKSLAGLQAPTRGVVEWDGRPVKTLSPAERRSQQGRFGMVFQTDALFDSKTVLENVALPLVNRGVPAAEAEIRALETLRRVGLESAAKKRSEQLSGGMRKRAGLARAVVAQPEVLLADDPLAGLDPRTASQICNLLAEVAATRTLVFCAPDPPDDFPFKRWLILSDGVLIHDGEPNERILLGGAG